MSDKTNEEKLRILQERLASIQQKKEIQQEEKVQQNKPVAPIFEEDLVNEPKKESDVIKKKSSAWKIIFFLILFSFLGGFGYYFYSNNFKIEPTIDKIKKDFDTISDKALSLFGNDEDKDKDEDEEANSDANEKPRELKIVSGTANTTQINAKFKAITGKEGNEGNEGK